MNKVVPLLNPVLCLGRIIISAETVTSIKLNARQDMSV